MFKDMTLGQYFPGDSPMHRLDPRTKILLMLAYIVAIFLIKELSVFSLAAVFIAIAVYSGRIPASYVLRSLKPLRWIILFMFLLNLFMFKDGAVLFEWSFIRVTWGGVEQAFFIALRLILLVSGTSLLMFTTTPIALTDGLERLLTPLSRLHFPAHELAMMMTIALRFIPTLLEEADKIMKAQLARGADFETGGIIKRAKGMVPILVPLLVSAFRRANELAMAMESRCYHGGEGRTRMRVLKFKSADALAAAAIAALIAAIVIVQAVLW